MNMRLQNGTRFVFGKFSDNIYGKNERDAENKFWVNKMKIFNAFRSTKLKSNV